MIGRFTNNFIALALLSVAGFAQTDGPATLPQSIPVQNWSSPNTPKIVGGSDNLQAAINAAVCGDTLLVDPANVTNGPVVFQNCLGSLGITIQGNVVGLPPAGSRVSPAAQMPKIILKGSQSVSNGGNVALIGFEITRGQGTGVTYNLINPTSAAHDLVFDRLYVHGNGTDDTVRGIMLHGHGISVINSYFSDFHCTAAIGACTDSQAIAGAIGDLPTDGSYLISNNYLEAAGENILFGGGGDTVTPCEITITGNTLHKPDSWNPADPSFVPISGHAFVVKNLFELKNACRVLFEHNTLSGSWGGFSQLGYAVLVTPKNQNNGCPACKDVDITIRNNAISKTCGAMQIGFGASDAGGFPTAAERYSFHDNRFTELQFANGYQCTHWILQVGSSNVPSTGAVLNNVNISNNSFLLSSTGWLGPISPTDGRAHGFLLLSAPSAAPYPFNMNFVGNVGFSGNTPIGSTGGGAGNCVNLYVGTSYANIFSDCWTTSSFTGNVILDNGYSGKQPWPLGNYVLAVGAHQN
jgi:hypothetical protein